ncbi:hypothetical protein HAHE_42530 [Haloferula helveola]|uniref:Uncharacterized protein n=1 Tax=Haloferula helveola TaxID=490095 RepID=A0ABM7RJZ3_9BACT|nr:hypothetical protein HAHE_42530 [Haloferula helveola]
MKIEFLELANCLGATDDEGAMVFTYDFKHGTPKHVIVNPNPLASNFQRLEGAAASEDRIDAAITAILAFLAERGFSATIS